MGKTDGREFVLMRETVNKTLQKQHVLMRKRCKYDIKSIKMSEMQPQVAKIIYESCLNPLCSSAIIKRVV